MNLLKSKLRYLVILVGIFTLLLQYNNCSEVQFSELEALSDGFAIDIAGPIDEEHEQEINEVISSCMNSTQIEVNTSLLFAKQTSVCEWGTQVSTPSANGNFWKRDGYFQARIEQDSQLSLPENSIICDIQFNSLESVLKYDGHFMLTMNNLVLMSTYKGFVLAYSQAEIDLVNRRGNQNVTPEVYLSATNGHYVYDWSKIGSNHWFGGNCWKDPGYCLGSEIMHPETGEPISSCT